VMLRARWVTLRARWVTLRARWVTLRARWVTLRARWVTSKQLLVEALGADVDAADGAAHSPLHAGACAAPPSSPCCSCLSAACFARTKPGSPRADSREAPSALLAACASGWGSVERPPGALCAHSPLGGVCLAAAAGGHVATVHALLQRAAKPGAADADGATPLHKVELAG
jgi:hypothetical protein